MTLSANVHLVSKKTVQSCVEIGSHAKRDAFFKKVLSYWAKRGSAGPFFRVKAKVRVQVMTPGRVCDPLLPTHTLRQHYKINGPVYEYSICCVPDSSLGQSTAENLKFMDFSYIKSTYKEHLSAFYLFLYLTKISRCPFWCCKQKNKKPPGAFWGILGVCEGRRVLWSYLPRLIITDPK